MKKYMYKINLVLMMTLLPLAGWSVEKKAQVGFRFLENPISAEAIGEGGMGIVGIENSTTVFWNPSGLGFMNGDRDVSANYTKGIADINYGAFSAAYKLGGGGVLAADMVYMDYGVFHGTIRSDNEDGFIETGEFSPTAYAVGLSYSQRVSDRFAYGVRLKYAYQDLGQVTIGVSGTDVDDTLLVTDIVANHHGEPAVDIGASYDFGDSGIRFGAVIQNVSREVKYVRESFPLPFAVGFSIQADVLKLMNKESAMHKFTAGVESSHPRDYKEKIKFGCEYTYLKAFTLRMGYRLNYDERGLSFGLGLNKRMGDTVLRVDYAYELYGVFGATNTFTVGSSF